MRVAVRSCRAFATHLGVGGSLTTRRAVCSRGFGCSTPGNEGDFVGTNASCLLKSSIFLVGEDFVVRPGSAVGSFFRMCSCQRSDVLRDFCAAGFPRVVGSPTVSRVLFSGCPILEGSYRGLTAVCETFNVLSVISVPAKGAGRVCARNTRPS